MKVLILSSILILSLSLWAQKQSERLEMDVEINQVDFGKVIGS